MHRTKHKPDIEATKARHFDSRYSYVSRRVHPGTEHSCEYLAGLKDIGARRREVFTRDGFVCVVCGIPITWESGHMAHGGNTKITRCDCLEALTTKCYECHMLREHNREVKWSPAWTR
jgi:hypothetical protein